MHHPQTPLCLRFGPQVTPAARARIEYAFRTFCAVYDRAYAADGAGTNAVRYGGEAQEGEIAVPALYDARPVETRCPPPAFVPLAAHPTYARLGIDRMPVFHRDGERVDWLGEIFEWLSSADDYAVTERDDVGRIPFAASLHGRYGLPPTIPYASVAMFEFARQLGIDPPSGKSSIAASHDLDYLPTDARGNLQRLVKNIGVALLGDRDVALAAGVAAAAAGGLVRGRSPLDYLTQMRERERKHGFDSTSNVICRNTCRRDGNYRLDHPRVRRDLEALHRSGAELGVHASYMSLRDGGLREEVDALRGLGYEVRGVRAHWLRYAAGDLFDAVADLGLDYDSTVGFADHVGFRTGASFVYRPYCFASESAYPFYEVPLAIMDGALYVHARTSGIAARALCERVLDMTDAFPAGGVSVLWHNTVFEGAQLPRDIGALYWKLPRAQQRWTTNAGVVDIVRPSFDRAFSGEPALC